MNCKVLNISLCKFCAIPNGELSCWIEYYKQTLAHKYTSEYIKAYISNIMRHPDTIYLYIAIKLYYPNMNLYMKN